VYAFKLNPCSEAKYEAIKAFYYIYYIIYLSLLILFIYHYPPINLKEILKDIFLKDKLDT